MTRPRPVVRVITWARSMRLKRRYEVQIGESGGDDAVPIARFVERTDADAFAAILRKAIGGER